MTTVNRNALVPYSADQIYQLVLDVDRYPEFLPWCDGAEVFEQSEESQLAAISIRKGPLNTRFKTSNTLTPGESISVSLVEGPFRSLTGSWTFKPLDENACKVEMNMEFDLAGPGALVIKPVFAQICNSLLSAFLDRARQVYGPS